MDDEPNDIPPPLNDGWLKIASCPHLSMHGGASCDLWVQLFSREPKAKVSPGCYWAEPYTLRVVGILVPVAGWATKDHVCYSLGPRTGGRAWRVHTMTDGHPLTEPSIPASKVRALVVQYRGRVDLFAAALAANPNAALLWTGEAQGAWRAFKHVVNDLAALLPPDGAEHG